jgi:hypothetical protein
MALNSPLSQPIFDILFADFNTKLAALVRFAKANSIGANGKSDLTLYNTYIPQNLRLFRVRLRLAIGLEIGFNLKYAMVKNEPTRQTYVHISKCNEAWFSFESMKGFCDSFNWSLSTQPTYELFSSPGMIGVDLNDVLLLTNNQIQANIYSNPKIQMDVKKYVGFLKDSSKPGLKAKLRITEGKIDHNQAMETGDLLALAYSIRNTYVHQGVSALSGIEKYKNKILLLKILFDFLILIQLKVIVHAIEHQINQNHIPYP